jgi:hypothetical protein
MKAARYLPACAAAIAAVLAAAPAEAQRTGSRIGRDATASDAGAAMQLVAECLVERRPELVKRLFRTLPGSTEESSMLSRQEGDLGICMEDPQLVLDGKQLRFKGRAIRTPLAKALIRKMLPSASAVGPAAPGSDPWFLAPYSALPPKAAVSRQHLNLLDFGHCVATTNWPATRAFLMAAPASAEESTAVKKLVPVLGPCLLEGMTVQLTSSVLRDALAEPVYQILMNPTSNLVAVN